MLSTDFCFISMMILLTVDTGNSMTLITYRFQSPWAQFFQDNELRRVILQDLQRTYPGELMFDQPEIQDMMLNILFIFARETPQIDYKQVKTDVNRCV